MTDDLAKDAAAGQSSPDSTDESPEIAAKQPIDSERRDAEINDTETDDNQIVDGEINDGEVTDIQPAETQLAETQLAETQSVDTQSVDTQPVDTQPADTRPAETKAADATDPQPATVRRHRSRLARTGLWSLVVILVLVLVAAVGGAWEVWRTFPQYDGVLNVTGLTGKVTVYRDNYAIPQLYAHNADDLFVAQGYVGAQERFWQMDFNRHVTSGTLSEMFGHGQLSTDEYLRTMGWRSVATQEWNLISPQSRQYLTDYAHGVNEYLRQHSQGAISLEYSVLKLQNHDYRIAPWSPIDSLAWLKALAWDLRGNMDDEITRGTLLADGLSRAQIESLYPAYPTSENAPIVASGSVRNGAFTTKPPPPAGKPAADAMPIPKAALPALSAMQTAVDAMPSVVGPSLPGIGSNSWVVSGRLTTTGKPILANDPHLAPSMPSIWYQMGLHCTCAFNVEGYTFAGVPGVVIGHNGRIAWGFTNLNPDVTDLYLERIKGDEYQVDGAWRPLSISTTTINVAGGKPVHLRIRSTNNGPLLSDVSTDLQAIAKKPDVDPSGSPVDVASAPAADPSEVSYAVALKWTALTPSNTMDAVFAINTAGDWDQFRAAARLFAVPAQNMIYADTDGNIGYQSPGLIPTRRKGDGRWPAPGWDSQYDWTGFIPFAQLPNVLNPATGFIATANQEVIDPSTYRPFLTDDWTYGYRSQRITDMISAASSGGRKISMADVQRMQFDTRNGFAAQIVPTLLTEHVDGTAAKAQALLNGWDFQQPADGKTGTAAAKSSAAAAYFNEFWHDLAKLTLDEIPAASLPDGGDRWFVFFDNLFRDPTNAWWDLKSTAAVETRDDIVTEALDQAASHLAATQGSSPAGWRWGKINQLDIQNQSLGTSGIGPVEWLFNYGPIGVPGGCDIVVATCSDLSHSFGTVDGVPTMRMIVDMSNLDNSRWVQLVGESGHTFSSHYHDQFNLWLHGQTLPMRWDQATISKGAKDTLTLSP